MSPKIILGTLLALGGAILGAVLWAAITASTHWQIGYMAVGVALLTGYAMRLASGGQARIEGILAAAIALFGCVLGNLFTAVVIIAQHEHFPIAATLAVVLSKPAFAWGLIADGFQPMDLLFYAIAVYVGYRTALKPRPPALAPAPEPVANPPAQ